MRHLGLGLVLSIPLMFGWGTASLASDNEGANRLLVQAITSWNEAAALSGDEQASAEAKVARLQQVAGNLNEIVQKHPGSDVAVKLVLGEDIGQLSIGAVQAALLIANAELGVAQCVENPTYACVLNLALWEAGSLEIYDHYAAKARIAASLAASERNEEAIALLESASDGWHFVFNRMLEVAKVMRSPEMFEEALEISRTLSHDPQNMTLEVVRGQAEAGLTDEAIRTSALLKDGRAKQYVLVEIARAYIKSGDHEAALGIAEDITEEDLRFSVFEDIVLAHATAGHIDDAIATAMALDHFTSLDYYRAKALIRIGGVTRDAELIEQAISEAEIEEDYLREALLEIAAMEYSRAGMIQEALKAMERVEDEETRNQVVHNIAVHYASEGMEREALKSIFDLIPMPYSVPLEEHNIALKAVAEIRAENGGAEAGLAIAGQITDNDILITARCGIAKIMAKKGDVTEALRVLMRTDIPRKKEYSIVYPDQTCRPETMGAIAAELRN